MATNVVLVLAYNIQLHIRIPMGEMQLLYGGRHLKTRKGLGYYAIKRDSTIVIVACLKGSYTGNGVSSKAKFTSFKDALNCDPISQPPKDLFDQAFVVGNSSETPSWEVNNYFIKIRL